MSEPTHNAGHTLDLVITRSDVVVTNLYVGATISDHALIRFNLSVKKSTDAHARTVTIRAVTIKLPLRLQLNPTKTEVLWLGSSQLRVRVSITDIPLQSTTIRVGEFARDLGVIIVNCAI